MKASKKISFILACVMSFTLIASGCSKDGADEPEAVTPNIITSADGGDNAQVTQATNAPNVDPSYETEVVTDEDGNAATNIDGEILTAPVLTEIDPAKTLAPDDIADLVTATTTKRTAVVTSTVDSNSRYAYNSLDDNEKVLYDAILDAATKLQSKLLVNPNLSLETWTKVFGMVYNQEPQLFWLNKKIKVGRLYYNETNPDKIKSMQKEIDATVDKLINESSGKSQAEKLKIFHDYIVLNSTFQKSSEVGAYNESIYNAFSGGTSSQGDIQCSGYAKSILYLCDKAGIDCMVIVGTDANGNSHAWNKVKVEGEWYNFDTTWDDPIFSTPIYDYVKYQFFLVPDEWVNNKTHFNINVKELNSGSKITYFTPPKATATSQNYFISNGFVYNDTASAEKAIKAELETAASSGKSVAAIMVGSKDVYNSLKSNFKSYQDDLKSKHSNVKAISDNSNEHLLVIQLDVKYN